MDANIVGATADGGRIAHNILGFARVLRSAGLPIGPQAVVTATEAVMAAGIGDPKMLYWSLHSVFVSRPSEREIFNQAFHLIWRDPGYIQQLMSVMVPNLRKDNARPRDAMARRLADSLFVNRHAQNATARDKFAFDARGTASDLEVMAGKDFEQMTADELRVARAVIRDLAQSLGRIRTRRYQARRGRGSRLDLKRMLSGAVRGRDLVPQYKERIVREPPLVVLCDISGSMDTYARLFLHFLYALADGRPTTHAFLFGTQLTNVTRFLRDRDPDAAIAKISGGVNDWAGGTRIGESLQTFNRLWGRRVLGQNATVLLFTDGLDRGEGEGVSNAVRRLRALCRRLIWLNPLLRYDQYQPIATGAAAISQFASETRPCHNLRSLADLGRVLADSR